MNRNPDMEAQLAKSPDDLALYQVYADWLSDRGDPRGELIALSLAAERDPADGEIKARLALLHEKHDREWLPGLEPRPEGMSLAWRRGFVDEVMLGDDEAAEVDLAELYRQLRTATRDNPLARIRKLTLGAFGNDDGEPTWDDVTDEIASLGSPPTLRELRYDRGGYWDISWTYLNNLPKLYPQLAALETLYIELGHMELGTIVLPALRDFEVYTGGFSAANMTSIMHATWPALERLVLRFGDSEDYGATCELGDVEPLLATSMPKLRDLGLANAGFANELVPVVAASPLVRQLRTLDLSMGVLDDTGAQALIEHAAKLAHLEKIDVSKSYIGADAAKALVEALPKVGLAGQKSADDYRYCEIGE